MAVLLRVGDIAPIIIIDFCNHNNYLSQPSLILEDKGINFLCSIRHSAYAIHHVSNDVTYRKYRHNDVIDRKWSISVCVW